MMLVALVGLILVVWNLIRSSKDDTIDFKLIRFVMQKDKDGSWRESRKALGEVVAIVASTWGFVFLVVAGKLTEFYFLGWQAILLGWSAIKSGIEKSRGAPPPQQ